MVLHESVEINAVHDRLCSRHPDHPHHGRSIAVSGIHLASVCNLVPEDEYWTQVRERLHPEGWAPPRVISTIQDMTLYPDNQRFLKTICPVVHVSDCAEMDFLGVTTTTWQFEEARLTDPPFFPVNLDASRVRPKVTGERL